MDERVRHHFCTSWYCLMVKVFNFRTKVCEFEPRHSIVLYCLDATDLKLSEMIWPSAKGKHNDEMIRLGILQISYSFRDVLGLFLASAQNAEYKAPSSSTLPAINRLESSSWRKPILKILGLPTPCFEPSMKALGKASPSASQTLKGIRTNTAMRWRAQLHGTGLNPHPIGNFLV